MTEPLSNDQLRELKQDVEDIARVLWRSSNGPSVMTRLNSLDSSMGTIRRLAWAIFIPALMSFLGILIFGATQVMKGA